MNFDLNEENKINQSNETTEDKKKKKEIINTRESQRILPKIINEVLNKNFQVNLIKDGYLISGFYGLNSFNNIGFVTLYEGLEDDTLVALDHKGNKHLIKSFEDLVFFNSLIWSYYFKQSDEYKKPNTLWFPFLLEYGALMITPK